MVRADWARVAAGARATIGRPGFSPSVREFQADARHTAGARGGAVPQRVGAKLPWMSRADSNTFEARSGRLVTRIYPFPVNYRVRSRRFTAIHTDLVATAGGFRQQANDLGVRLPAVAGGAARLKARAGALSFSLAGARGRGVATGSVERFGAAGRGLGLSYESLSSGIAWQARTSAAATGRGLSWRFGLPRGVRARLVSGGVAFVNVHGRTVWRFAVPSAHAVGSRAAEGTRISLRPLAGGVVVHVAVAGRLSSIDRVGADVVSRAGVAASPTVWDGQVVPGTFSDLTSSTQTGSCYLASGSPTTSYCGASTNYVGPADTTLVNFNVAGSIPTHVQVLQSFVMMGLSSAASTTAEDVGVWQAAEPWTSAATWNTYDGTHAWTAGGGDVTGPMLAQEDLGASGDTGQEWFWDITAAMQGWVDQNPATVDGLIFKATAGTGAPNTLGFTTPLSSSQKPYIEVYEAPRLGDYPGAKYDSQQLTAQSSLGVNVATGNLQVSNNDLNMTGVDGLNVQVGRYYNDLSTSQDAFGVGWSMATGADTYLAIPSDGSNTVEFFDGTGNVQSYSTPPGSSTETSPPGEDGQLTMNDAGSTYDSSTFTLNFRHAGITETFTAPANALNKVAKLSTLTDRHGNTITYHYNSSNQLTSITDSYGNTTTITWSTAGYISEIEDPTGRTYYYWQNSSGELTKYEDPDGNYTYYTYDNYGNLTKITTPAGNITKVAYDAGATNRVTSVERFVKPTDTSGPTTSYSYGSPTATCSTAGAGWTQTVATDPNSHTTTYCTDDLSRIEDVIDASGNTEQTSYDTDSSDTGFVGSETTALGTQTSFSYKGDGTDNVSSIQEGTGTGSMTEGFTYTEASNPYLPTTATDAQGNTTSTAYDSTGDPLSETNGSTASTLTYNTNGTVKTSEDADSNTTHYYYTSGNLTEIVPPSGNSLNNTYLTYDSANRVASISTINTTAGTGYEVQYTYNGLDEITQAEYSDAAGDTSTFTYSYSHDGEMTKRTGSAGSSTYTYDGLGRITAESLVDGTSDSYTYDAASNLTGLTDAGGTVTYGYNAINELTSVTDPGASTATALTYDADRNLTGITYPSGVSVAYTYNLMDQLTETVDTYKTSGGSTTTQSFTNSWTNPTTSAPADLIYSTTTGAGAVTSYSYDALNRLTQADTVQSGTTLADYQYSLDGNGNILEQSVSGSAVTAATTNYGYNSANQICWSDTSAVTSHACTPAPTGSDTGYTYGANGYETTNGAGLTMSYNLLGQMTSATNAGTTTNYGYLGAGNQELEAENSKTLHNDILGLAWHQDGSGTDYFTRSVAGQQLDERTASGTYNYLYDADGNIIGLTNSTGQLINQYAYTPYGTPTTSTGTAPNYFGFQSGYRDPSGLDHFGARYMDPAQGGWTQQDPLTQIGSLTQGDRYLYAADDPIDLSDPDGTSATDRCAIAAATILLACTQNFGVNPNLDNGLNGDTLPPPPAWVYPNGDSAEGEGDGEDPTAPTIGNERTIAPELMVGIALHRIAVETERLPRRRATARGHGK
jgi:RHS repeat-associated protein